MKSTLTDREFSKFRDGKTGDAVAVTFDGEAIPIESSGVEWDEISTTFPSDTQELYTYKKDTVTVQTVFITYQDAAKKIITLIQKTRF